MIVLKYGSFKILIQVYFLRNLVLHLLFERYVQGFAHDEFRVIIPRFGRIVAGITFRFPAINPTRMHIVRTCGVIAETSIANEFLSSPDFEWFLRRIYMIIYASRHFGEHHYTYTKVYIIRTTFLYTRFGLVFRFMTLITISIFFFSASHRPFKRDAAITERPNSSVLSAEYSSTPSFVLPFSKPGMESKWYTYKNRQEKNFRWHRKEFHKYVFT